MQESPDPSDQHSFLSTYGMIFFGVPSEGMYVKDLVAMDGEHPQGDTLRRLDEDVGSLLKRNQHKRFCEAFAFKDSEIVQFYETMGTETRQEVAVSNHPIAVSKL